MRDSRKLDAVGWIGALVAAALALAACAAPPSATTPTATPALPPDPEPPSAAVSPASPADRAPIVYVVRSGDTLTRIAGDYGVAVAHLMQANQLRDPDHLKVGQSMRIPAPAAGGDRAEALVEQAANHYRNARFDVALARAQRAEAILAAREGSREADQRRWLSARAAFIAGCSLAAFGEDGQAIAAFSRARALYPAFEPPVEWLSPRLEKLYLAAQER